MLGEFQPLLSLSVFDVEIVIKEFSKQPRESTLLPNAFVGVDDLADSVHRHDESAVLEVDAFRDPKRECVGQQAIAVDCPQRFDSFLVHGCDF